MKYVEDKISWRQVRDVGDKFGDLGSFWCHQDLRFVTNIPSPTSLSAKIEAIHRCQTGVADVYDKIFVISNKVNHFVTNMIDIDDPKMSPKCQFCHQNQRPL